MSMITLLGVAPVYVFKAPLRCFGSRMADPAVTTTAVAPKRLDKNMLIQIVCPF
jgi:hypothetical protein